jgi:hypothetical protein
LTATSQARAPSSPMQLLSRSTTSSGDPRTISPARAAPPTPAMRFLQNSTQGGDMVQGGIAAGKSVEKNKNKSSTNTNNKNPAVSWMATRSGLDPSHDMCRHIEYREAHSSSDSLKSTSPPPQTCVQAGSKKAGVQLQQGHSPPEVQQPEARVITQVLRQQLGPGVRNRILGKVQRRQAAIYVQHASDVVRRVLLQRTSGTQQRGRSNECDPYTSPDKSRSLLRCSTDLA